MLIKSKPKWFFLVMGLFVLCYSLQTIYEGEDDPFVTIFGPVAGIGMLFLFFRLLKKSLILLNDTHLSITRNGLSSQYDYSEVVVLKTILKLGRDSSERFDLGVFSKKERQQIISHIEKQKRKCNPID